MATTSSAAAPATTSSGAISSPRATTPGSTMCCSAVPVMTGSTPATASTTSSAARATITSGGTSATGRSTAAADGTWCTPSATRRTSCATASATSTTSANGLDDPERHGPGLGAGAGSVCGDQRRAVTAPAQRVVPAACVEADAVGAGPARALELHDRGCMVQALDADGDGRGAVEREDEGRAPLA